MTRTIDRRLEALEAIGDSGVNFILILRQIVTPGIPVGEAVAAEMMGERFERTLTETEDDFIARLRDHAEMTRKPGQRAVQVIMEEVDLDL
jgi:hypothetical protein